MSLQSSPPYTSRVEPVAILVKVRAPPQSPSMPSYQVSGAPGKTVAEVPSQLGPPTSDASKLSSSTSTRSDPSLS